MKKLFEYGSPHLVNFFNNCFTKSSYCDKINHVRWRKNTQKEMLRFRHSSITAEDTNNQISETDTETNRLLKCFRFFRKVKDFMMGEEMKKTPVKVTLLKTNWIFRGTH